MPKHSKTKTIKPLTRATIELFLAQEREAKKDRPKITYGEKLIFLFKTLIEFGWRNEEGVLIVPFEKIMVEPYFYYDASHSVYEELPFLFKAVQTDKDFYRKHNMLNYEPTFAFNTNHEYSNISEDLVFKDYTNDFLKEYLKDRLGIKYRSKNKSDDKTIQKIEVLQDKTERGRINVYINGNYENEPLNFARKGSWQLLYKVAKKEYIDYDKTTKTFYDYFNSNKNNPIYANGFEGAPILKIEDGGIVPNIEIKLIAKSKVTRQLKSA